MLKVLVLFMQSYMLPYKNVRCRETCFRNTVLSSDGVMLNFILEFTVFKIITLLYCKYLQLKLALVLNHLTKTDLCVL